MTTGTINEGWALVTGASSGLGIDFARELAKRNSNLILAARREERLREVGDGLAEAYGVEVDAMPLDLSDRNAPQELFNQIRERGRHVDVLINNAGFGVHGHFVDNAWDRELEMIELDVVTLVHLTKLFVPGMVERGFGRILQVASTAAYQPVPTYAVYGACKAFVLSFGEALNYELRGSGVSCTVVSPGVTDTEFQEVAGHDYTTYMRAVQMKSEDVARIGIRAMLRGRSSVVTGIGNAAMVTSERLLPRPAVTALAGYFMKERE